jgi:citrate lyase subunit beta/citryl-CoA lyase
MLMSEIGEMIGSWPRARRSCLSVPATSESKLRKAANLDADEVVIDLEDSVPSALKHEALATALDALSWWPESGPSVSVRINPPRTPWCHTELATLAAAPEALKLTAIVIPKVESAGDLAFAERLLDGAEAASDRRNPLKIQALIETAPGLARLDEIAGSSRRLATLILGYGDLGASLGRRAMSGSTLDLWHGAQHDLLVAARTRGLQAIDGPFLGVANDEPFRAATERARDLGFDGKWAIHPSQIRELNELFTPSHEEVEYALEVIDILASTEANGAGAVTLDGQMIDEAVRQSALRTLARARMSG